MSTPLDRQHSAAETSPAHWPATANSSWQPETTAERADGAHEPLSRIEGWVQATHGGITHHLYLATDDTGEGGESGTVLTRFLGHAALAAAHVERQTGVGPQSPRGTRHPSGRRRRLAGDRPALTPAQADVMRLLDQGLSARQVAERLIKSEHTVYKQVRGVIEQLEALGFEVSGMRGALSTLRRLGLLDDNVPS